MSPIDETNIFNGVPSTDDLIARVKVRRRLAAKGGRAQVGVEALSSRPVHAAGDRRPLALRLRLPDEPGE